MLTRSLFGVLSSGDGSSTFGLPSRMRSSSYVGSSEKPGPATAGRADLHGDHDLLAQALSRRSSRKRYARALDAGADEMISKNAATKEILTVLKPLSDGKGLSSCESGNVRVPDCSVIGPGPTGFWLFRATQKSPKWVMDVASSSRILTVSFWTGFPPILPSPLKSRSFWWRLSPASAAPRCYPKFAVPVIRGLVTL